MDAEKLPTYDELPHEFVIGNKRIQRGLVTVNALKRHLLVLGALHKLKQAVQSDEWLVRYRSITDDALSPVENDIADPAVRWSVFVAMGVFRLALWINEVLQRDLENDCVPPLDVVLILHAYRLNPRWYREDIMRKHPQLERANDVLLDRVADLINATTFEFTASQEATDKWFAITDTAWDPFVHFATSSGRPLKVPPTAEFMTVPWMTEAGTGWAQQSFSAVDSRGQVINHEYLGVFKLISDLRACHTHKNVFLASLAFSPADKGDGAAMAKAARINQVLFRTGSPLRPLFMDQLVAAVGTTRHSARKAILGALNRRSAPPGFNVMMGAYSRGEQFSLDLAAAVLRQGSFIDKMVQLGWLAPRKFDKDDGLLQRAVARYHAFLDLSARSPAAFLVPTLDIDLAWHTHQLDPRSYKEHTINLLGHFMDHDDKVAEHTLFDSFQRTARLWWDTYHVPYSLCGCPLPEISSKSLTRKLRKKLGFKTKPDTRRATYKVLLAGSNHDHYTLEDLDSTHPSEHSRVVVTGSSLRAERAAHLRERSRNQQTRDEWLFQRNELDPFLTKSRQCRTRCESSVAGSTHTTAFLYPVPLGICYGTDGYPIAGGTPDGVGCAATDGSIVGGDHYGVGQAGSGSCAIGVGMCAGDLGGGVGSSGGAGSCMAGSSSWGGDSGGGFGFGELQAGSSWSSSF
ncbi:hypothetical protein OIV83_003262 [Microbotryomycetes sp. JL201]|nr:hypothetical protein OIV83_003262 [Microbotryomycetes sp. JL201]